MTGCYVMSDSHEMENWDKSIQQTTAIVSLEGSTEGTASSADSNTKFIFKGEVVPVGVGQMKWLGHPWRAFLHEDKTVKQEGAIISSEEVYSQRGTALATTAVSKTPPLQTVNTQAKISLQKA